MSRYTLATSITNRFTGVALSAGLLLLVYWLMALAGGPQSYARALRVLAAPPARLIYAALVIAFCYHLVAGLRHLVWDTGHGLERAQSQRSAWLVVGVSILLMLLILYRALGTHGS
ncbi:MAG: succinate dehydrogenase, cytochrome b556 subunit [Gammaproteobacteria bacterium]|nr:succinate dehydrogenase, cytochrome b556 subunit [Gammaproteobacteria bacterium]MBV8405197.1 succinate dehydrogenase, cytochrome b556 subunit [Gammaproteobacteria bacterium]